MSKIKRLSGRFIQLKAQHIYRTFNKEADKMSNEALQWDEEGVFFSKDVDGHPMIFERVSTR